MKNNSLFNLEVNTLGRFSMSPWQGKKYEIKNKYNKNLPNWLSLKIDQEKIIKNFLIKILNKKISHLTLHDVGCNDGYFTEELAKLNFKSVIGTEPRKSNIIRGYKIRKLLNIKSRVKYFTKRIEELKKKFSADIVNCSGVLHHTSNIEKSFNILLNISNQYLIIEGEFLPSSLLKNKKIISSTQLKDLFYKQNSKIQERYSISINKFETNFLDGSAFHNGIVETPTSSKLIMLAAMRNFELVYFKEKKYKNILNTNRCILVFKKNLTFEKKNFKKIYIQEEMDMIFNPIPLYILKKIKKRKKFQKMQKYENILEKLYYSFNDKINFEFAKSYFFLENKFLISKKYLEKIIYKKNADWFSCYRSFALMAIIDYKHEKNWKKRLFLCNPSFPRELIPKLKKNFNAHKSY